MTDNPTTTTTAAPAVTVFCGASQTVDPKYNDLARELGHRLASRGITVVSGGGRAGLMGSVIDGAADAGGRTVGVIPQFMVDRGWHNPRLSELIVTDSMLTRKAKLAQLSTACIALPGGCGTLDELFEVIVGRQLGLYHGHVIILNQDGYYDPLVEMLDRMVDLHFMNPDHRRIWFVTDNLDDAVERAASPVSSDQFSQKL